MTWVKQTKSTAIWDKLSGRWHYDRDNLGWGLDAWGTSQWGSPAWIKAVKSAIVWYKSTGRLHYS